MGWKDQAIDAAPQPQEQPGDSGWRSSSVPAINTPPPSHMIDGLVENSPGLKIAQNPWEAFMAGLHSSASGLIASGGKAPDLTVPKNASFFQKVSNGVGAGLGDLPFNIAGFVGGVAVGGGVGAGAGAAVPVAGETGVSEVAGGGAGAVVGGGAGSMALPQAVRETMMDYYQLKTHGGSMTWQDIAGMIAKSSWNIGKQAVVGAVAGKAGGAAGAYAADIGAPAYAATTANIVGFSGAATTTQAVMDGHAPDASDFAAGTLAALPFGLAGHVVPMTGKAQMTPAGETVMGNMQDGYRSHGIPPWQQADMAKRDPVLHDELVSQDVNGQPVQPKFNSIRPEEPEPFHEPPSAYKITAMKLRDEHEQEVSDLETGGFAAAHASRLLPKVRALEGSGDQAVSPAGAIGRYQIMPGTARQYGFDPARLTDPAYNERAAHTILTDLSRRFHGDEEAILIAYNAGPGRAFRFIRDGRDTGELPRETQKYLERGGFGGKGGEPPEPPHPPEEPPMIEGPGGEQQPDFSKLSLDSLRSRFQDAIGQEPSKPNTGSFMRQWVSELESARGIDKEMTRRGLLDPSKDLTTEEMFRSTYASDDRAQYMFVKGNIDPITLDAKEGPALLDVMGKIKEIGGNLDDYNLYRVAARTVEKAGQGVDTGVFKGGAAEAGHVYQLPELQKYKAVDDIMQQWKHGTLEYGRDSGLWDQGRLDAMEAANTSHVSLRRVMGDDAAFSAGQSGPSKFRTRNPLKEMEGSDRQIIEPLTADMDNARQIIRMADRNRAIGHVVMSEEARSFLGLKKLPAPEVKAMLAEPGSDVFKPYSMTPEQEKAFGSFALQKEVGTGKRANQFVFYRDGKPEVWEAKDPDVAALMRGADSPGEADIITKVLSIPAKLERAGIMAAPDFAFRVPMRHQLTAWVLDPQHPAPYITAVRGAMDVLGKGDAFWDLMRRGGLSGAITEMDLAKGVDRAVGDQDTLTETGALEKTWNSVKHPLQFAQIVTEKLTQMERVGYYKDAVRGGIEPNKAAMMGRKAYLDFSEKATGVIANKMAQFVPFFRATMLGLRQGRDAVVDNPGKTLTYASLGLVLPQVALYALNRGADKFLDDKDKYTSLLQWQRDQYFITPPIGGVRFRLARPYVIGPMIGAPVERFLEAEFEKNPHAFDDVLHTMFIDAVPGNMPTALRPIYEQQTNHNFFTGAPLVSDNLKEATADQQYTEHTSELAKKISGLLGNHTGMGVAEVSPIVLDNYVQEWGGTTGAVILHSLDAPLGKPSMDTDWRDMPFVRGFVIQNPRMNTQQVSDFYRDAEKWNALHRDVSLEVKRGNIEQAMQDKTGVGQKAVLVTKVEHALNVQHTALAALQRRKDLNTDEKRQLSERIYQDAWQIARFGSRALRGDNVTNEEAEQIGNTATENINAATGGQ